MTALSSAVAWETSIPVIVVGRVAANVAIRKEHGSCQDKYFPVQLYRVTVDVENVLRGENIPSQVDVYYFSGLGSHVGPARLGMRENGGRRRLGDRELFLLRRDSGVLRTKYDARRRLQRQPNDRGYRKPPCY
jgi:hypothetical protein